MDDTKASSPTDATTPGLEDQDTRFDPEPRPADVFFAIVDPDQLAEAATLHENTDGNAVVLVRGERGLRVRGRSYNCYWFDIELPPRVFDLFEGDEADFWIDPDALSNAVQTQTDRVALRGTPDCHLLLESPHGVTDLYTDSLPFLKDDSDEVQMNPDKPTAGLRQTDRYDPTQHGHVLEKFGSFELEAETLRGIATSDRDHDHMILSVDIPDQTVEWSFFDLEGETHTVGLSLGPDQLVSPPSPIGDDLPTETPIQKPVCRNGFETSVTGFRDTVEIWLSHVPFSQVYTQYNRGDSDLRVYAMLGHEEGALSTMERVLDSP